MPRTKATIETKKKDGSKYRVLKLNSELIPVWVVDCLVGSKSPDENSYSRDGFIYTRPTGTIRHFYALSAAQPKFKYRSDAKSVAELCVNWVRYFINRSDQYPRLLTAYVVMRFVHEHIQLSRKAEQYYRVISVKDAFEKLSAPQFQALTDCFSVKEAEFKKRIIIKPVVDLFIETGNFKTEELINEIASYAHSNFGIELEDDWCPWLSERGQRPKISKEDVTLQSASTKSGKPHHDERIDKISKALSLNPDLVSEVAELIKLRITEKLSKLSAISESL